MSHQAKASQPAKASQDPTHAHQERLHPTNTPSEHTDSTHPLVSIAQRLRDALSGLSFRAPTTHVYHPLVYAWEAHKEYLTRFGGTPPREMFWLGMNPGPWGMTQTGIPFGAIPFVRDWMQIHTTIHPPTDIHPKRPIEGFDCTRTEISGTRLWGWAKYKAPHAPDFFSRIFLNAYCPLAFLEESGKNRTPDKLHPDERAALFALCDQALRDTLDYLQPRTLVAIGAFAESRLKHVLGPAHPPILRILHPSPASPLANYGWAEQVEHILQQAEISLTFPHTNP